MQSYAWLMAVTFIHIVGAIAGLAIIASLFASGCKRLLPGLVVALALCATAALLITIARSIV